MRTIIIRADAVLVWFLMQAASIPILAFCEPKGHVNWIVISFWVRILAIFEGGGRELQARTSLTRNQSRVADGGGRWPSLQVRRGFVVKAFYPFPPMRLGTVMQMA